LYIGAVAVLPTYAPLATVLIERSTSLVLLDRLLEESKSGKQALREVRMKHSFVAVTERRVQFGAMAFGVVCMFLVA
jgi:hypothetical protein